MEVTASSKLNQSTHLAVGMSQTRTVLSVLLEINHLPSGVMHMSVIRPVWPRKIRTRLGSTTEEKTKISKKLKKIKLRISFKAVSNTVWVCLKAMI